MQKKPQVIAILTIVFFILSISLLFGVGHLKERIYKIEISVADSRHIANNVTTEVEELRAIIEELQSEVEDLKNQRQPL
jgi:hypothetical protein